MAMGDPDPMDFVDATDVDLLGVMNTVAVSLPHLPDGASVIVTGSTAGLMPGTADNPIMGPGGAGYGWSKRVLVQYVEQMALQLARSEEHTSELQSLMRISYAVFCLKKKKY